MEERESRGYLGTSANALYPLLVKYLSPHTNLVIIRVSREHFRTLWAALTLLRKLAGEEVIARVLHVSGEF